MVNLDTHILVFALAGQLTAAEAEILAGQQWAVSDIVWWELARLVQRGRIKLNLDDPQVQQALARIHVLPISLEIARVVGTLDFRSDPADQIIAATSMVHGIPLVTRDHVIRASKLVTLA